ncbi:MAG: histidine phosphatase family protein [Candidatus Rokubacteria bacterium]|nr:histidine phosphatase family protein [Candidatus Rokubacteria bacterium]
MGKLRLFVIRHGETAWSRERRFTGSRDVALTELGLRQCDAVAQALAPQPLAAVYASPLERARTSAEIIAKPHRLEVRVEAAFREMMFGPWEGLTREEVAARFPDDYARWRTAPDTLALPDAETLPEVAARVRRGLAALAGAHPDATLVLVSHAVIARALVLDALGLGLDRLWSVDASPAGITEVEFEPGWATVHRMNTLAHLEAAGP